ncbi:MAG: cation diffusion facilitator family transporter [Ruminococcus flavefaciens]|nr:cation diffusion facilitator family transporter [Ruminococcus flavefaciens]
MKSNNLEIAATRVSVVTIIINFILAAFKLFAGIFGNSYALISDSVHSASDVFSTVIVLIGVKISAKKADKNHQFGHERFECVAAILLAAVLFATGSGIGYSGISDIVTGEYNNFAVPGIIALVAAAVSIVVKEGMFWYTYLAAKKVNSSALKADAWHHRSDALSSVGSLIGVIGGLCGVKILDSVACIVICLFILKAAVQIFWDSIKKMTDEACDEKTVSEIRDFIASCEGVMRVDKLLTRMFGNRIFVIAEIACERELPLYAAHTIAERVHKGIEENFSSVKHVTVHVNPYNPEISEDEEI